MTAQKSRGWQIQLLSLALIAGVLTACGTGSKPAVGPDGKAGANSTKTLVIAQSPDFDTLDPAKVNIVSDSNAAKQIFEGLTGIDSKGSIAPVLATSWETAPDGLSWTFHLRQGVKFHDGTPLDAQAVKGSLDRTRDLKFGVKATLYSPIKEITVVDAQTVQVMLNRPFGSLLQTMAHWSAYIVSPTAVQKFGGNFSHNPVGTGPFKLESWTPGKLTMVRNPDYWQAGLPKLSRVEFRVVMEDGARAAMLKTGEAGMIYPTPPALVADLQHSDGVKVDTLVGSRVMWGEFNYTRPAFQDPKVRQAFNYAIDRKGITTKLLNGLADPIGSVISPVAFGSASVGTVEYNADKAKQLLADAGWKPGPDGILVKDGKKFAIKIGSTKGRYPADTEIVQAVAGQLKAIGVEATIDANEYATWIQKVSVAPEANPYDLIFVAIAATVGDADTPLRITSIKTAFAPKNWGFGYYSDPDVEQWMQQQYESADQKVRADLFKQIQQKMFDNSAVLFMHVYHNVMSRSANVQGIEMTPLDSFDLSQASWSA